MIVLGVGISNISYQSQEPLLSDLTLANIEAMAGDGPTGEKSTCFVSSISKENIGVCKANVDETGDFCADRAWYDPKNCYGNS